MRTCALLVLAALVAGCGGVNSDSLRVTPDGRIGPLQIDVSTEADVRDFAGKPFKVEGVGFPAKQGSVGRELYYRCGSGCVTAYAVSNETGRLVDYYTQSPEFITEHGSRVGMPARPAAAREGRRIVGGCGEGKYIHLRWDKNHMFVLGVFNRRVSLIAYLGPHTLSYEGLC